MKATLTDAGRGPLAGVPVTFTLPSSAPGAVLPEPARRRRPATTNAQGVATAPQMNSRLVVGTFRVTVTAPDAAPATAAMATQYFVGPFASPINPLGTTSRPVGATTQLSTLVLQPIQLIPDTPRKR